MKYYVEKNWFNEFGDCISYESGALNDMYFDTESEAENYAKEHEFMLKENEVFIVCEMENKVLYYSILENGFVDVVENINGQDVANYCFANMRAVQKHYSTNEWQYVEIVDKERGLN